MSKWENPGREFDDLGCNFIQNKDILIIGDDENCKRVQMRFKFLNSDIKMETNPPEYNDKNGFISNVDKILFRLKLRKFIKMLPSDCTLILADNKAWMKFEKYRYVSKWLKKIGRQLGRKIYGEEEFFRNNLSIYAAYVKDLVYFRDTSFICTTVCNLNCKSCLNLNPYFKNKCHRNIDELKKDIDIYFKCVDMVGRFHISGGEPQLYPDLAELILYIHNNYSSKIETLAVVTNGTIIPSDKLCETLKCCNVTVEVDDYRENVPKLKETYPKVVQKLKHYGIMLEELAAGEVWEWFEIFPPKNVIEKENTKSAIERYTKCGNPFMGLANQKLNSCCYAGFAETAGLVKQGDDEFFDLASFTQEKKKELVEFRLRFNKKGYTNFCRYCNGFPAINPNRVKPAIQAESLMEWNINRPYEMTMAIDAQKS